MLRVTILSIILFSLIVYLGIKYHWGDHFSTGSQTTIDFKLPEKITHLNIENTNTSALQKSFKNPQILEKLNHLEIISLMNKDQIKAHCHNLLSKTIKENLTLLPAIGNCVVSNYQKESEKNISNRKVSAVKNTAYFKCAKIYQNQNIYTQLEKQLLIGMCISDENVK